MNETSTDSKPRRVAAAMRCCTTHIPLTDHRELCLLALEDSTDGASLTYADELRIAVREYIQRRRSTAPQPKRQQLDAGVDPADGYGGGRLLSRPMYMHHRGRTSRSSTTCGLSLQEVPDELVNADPKDADCPRCRSILDTNAATMAEPTRARKPSKPAKKGPRRR